MDTARVELTPHERGSEVDVDVNGLSVVERLVALGAAFRALFCGRIHFHLWHARVEQLRAVRVGAPARASVPA